MAEFGQKQKYQGAQITHMQNQDANQTLTSGATAAHTQQQTADLQRKAATEAETRGVVERLYKAENPNASDDQVKAAGLRVMDGQVDKNAPAEVKLASAMVKFGVAPDMKTALERSMSSKEASPDKLRADVTRQL